ncbi:MAG TPA: hypothetical protein PLD59_05855 [Tepidisphaeraceae bacterium]|nr:hypothetical protein [Tepidisphaeraceae bacterium]
MNDVDDNPEQAQLLLYLANEMPPAPRQALEKRLEADADLRDHLAALREADSSLNQGLAGLDAAEPIEVRLRSAERETVRSLRQWHIDRSINQTPQSARLRVRRVPFWLYPLTAAAVVLVGLGLWYLSFDRNADGTLAHHDDSDTPRMPVWDAPDDNEAAPDIELAVRDSDSFGELEEEMSKLIALSRALQ